MKNGKILSVLISLVALSASAQHYSFTNTVNAPIPDANPTGLFSAIDVAGIPGTVSNVTLSLTISGGFNGDLYGYLSGDNGGFAVLMNRVGRTSTDPTGYGDAGVNIILSDAAASDIHSYGGNGGNPLTGTWQADGRNVDPQLVLDTDPRTAFLNSFDNRAPNGTWTLYWGDFANQSESTLVSWSLNFDVVPEPGTFSLFAVGFGILLAAKRRRH